MTPIRIVSPERRGLSASIIKMFWRAICRSWTLRLFRSRGKTGIPILIFSIFDNGGFAEIVQGQGRYTIIEHAVQ